MSRDCLANLERAVMRMNRLLGEADFHVRRTRGLLGRAQHLGGCGVQKQDSEDGWRRYY